MIILRILLSLIFVTLLQVSVIFIALLSILPLGSRFFYFLCRWLLRLILMLSFIRVTVAGKKNIPVADKLMFISNYPALMDPLYLIAYFPLRLRILAEESMFKIPFLGRVMRVLGCIAIPASAEGSFPLVNSILAAFRKNEAVWVFAEDPAKREGALKMAASLGAKAVEIRIEGSKEVLPKGSMLLLPGRVDINISLPL